MTNPRETMTEIKTIVDQLIEQEPFNYHGRVMVPRLMNDFTPEKVWRHLRDGFALLLDLQPGGDAARYVFAISAHDVEGTDLWLVTRFVGGDPLATVWVNPDYIAEHDVRPLGAGNDWTVAVMIWYLRLVAAART